MTLPGFGCCILYQQGRLDSLLNNRHQKNRAGRNSKVLSGLSLSLLVNISESLPAAGRTVPSATEAMPLWAELSEHLPFWQLVQVPPCFVINVFFISECVWQLIEAEGQIPTWYELAELWGTQQSFTSLDQMRCWLYSWNPHKLFEPVLFQTLLGHP